MGGGRNPSVRAEVLCRISLGVYVTVIKKPLTPPQVHVSTLYDIRFTARYPVHCQTNSSLLSRYRVRARRGASRSKTSLQASRDMTTTGVSHGRALLTGEFGSSVALRWRPLTGCTSVVRDYCTPSNHPRAGRAAGADIAVTRKGILKTNRSSFRRVKKISSDQSNPGRHSPQKPEPSPNSSYALGIGYMHDTCHERTTCARLHVP